MATKKKRKKPVSKKQPAKRKAGRVFVKPPGIRVEDLKPNTVFKFIMDDSEEIHLALKHKYQTSGSATLVTWLLSGHDQAPCEDRLPAEVDWDYQIEILGLVNAEDVAKKIIKACKK